jgi:hypothetical protein
MDGPSPRSSWHTAAAEGRRHDRAHRQHRRNRAAVITEPTKPYVFGSPVITIASCLVDAVRGARNYAISECLC